MDNSTNMAEGKVASPRRAGDVAATLCQKRNKERARQTHRHTDTQTHKKKQKKTERKEGRGHVTENT